MLLIGVKTMKRKEPNEKFRTTTISLEPGLYEAFDIRVKEERTTRSAVIATLIQSWLSGEPVTRPNGDPAPIPVIDMDKLTREITDRVLRSIPHVTVPPTLKPEQTQITITPPEPTHDQDNDQEQGEEPARPVFEYKNGKVSIPVVRDYLTYHIRKYQEATGVNDMFIVKTALGGKKSLLSSIVAGSTSYKQISKEDIEALEALVIKRLEKSSPEGT